MLRGSWDSLLDLFFPPRCVSCHRLQDQQSAITDSPLCRECRTALPWLPIGSRSICDPERPQASARPGGNPRGNSALSACHAGVSLEGTAQEWIHRLKYPSPGLRGLDAAPLLVVQEWIRVASSEVTTPRPDWIVPVPLHPKRLRGRGFNVAALLAHELCRATGAPLVAHALVRTQNTPSQTHLDRRKRLSNLRNAFSASLARPYPRSIWLIDDVVTTTATLEAAARVLSARGVREIVGICAAHTPQPPSAELPPRSRASRSRPSLREVAPGQPAS